MLLLGLEIDVIVGVHRLLLCVIVCFIVRPFVVMDLKHVT